MEEIEALQARDTDAEEDARFGESLRGDELPEELRRRADRLAAIVAAKARLEAAQREADDARRRRDLRSAQIERGAGESRHDLPVKRMIFDPHVVAAAEARDRTRYLPPESVGCEMRLGQFAAPRLRVGTVRGKETPLEDALEMGDFPLCLRQFGLRRSVFGA